MPSSFAMCATFLPSRNSRTASSAFARAVGLRPLYFPSAFALAMPSRWRSSMISRSNCAIAANMFSMSRPVALRVSTASPSEVEDAERDAFRLQRIHQLGEVARAAGEAVELGYDQRVALAGVIERRLQLG